MKQIYVNISKSDLFTLDSYQQDASGNFIKDENDELVKKENYQRYKVSVTTGNATSFTDRRMLDDDEPSIDYPEMTALEYLQHRRDNNNKSGWPIMESVHIDSIDNAVKVAGDLIDSFIHKDEDLSLFTQPLYLLEDIRFKPNNHEFVKGTKASSTDKTAVIRYPEINASIDDLKSGDVISISNANKLTFPMLKVVEKNGILGFHSKGMLDYFADSFVALKDLDSLGFTVSKVNRRKEVVDLFATHPRKIKDIEFLKGKAKSGSLTSLLDARESVKQVYDYFHNRVKGGDILLDQWMADAYESSKESLEQIEKLIRALHPSKFDSETK